MEGREALSSGRLILGSLLPPFPHQSSSPSLSSPRSPFSLGAPPFFPRRRVASYVQKCCCCSLADSLRGIERHRPRLANEKRLDFAPTLSRFSFFFFSVFVPAGLSSLNAQKFSLTGSEGWSATVSRSID